MKCLINQPESPLLSLDDQFKSDTNNTVTYVPLNEEVQSFRKRERKRSLLMKLKCIFLSLLFILFLVLFFLYVFYVLR